MAGEDWMNLFLARHPDLSIRKAEETSSARTRGFNRPNVTWFFNLLINEVDKHKLTRDIQLRWNCHFNKSKRSFKNNSCSRKTLSWAFNFCWDRRNCNSWAMVLSFRVVHAGLYARISLRKEGEGAWIRTSSWCMGRSPRNWLDDFWHLLKVVPEVCTIF